MENQPTMKELQRAAWAGLIVSILEDNGDLSINEIKLDIASLFSELILMGVVEGDEIDLRIGDACKRILEAEMAVRDVKDFLEKN